MLRISMVSPQRISATSVQRLYLKMSHNDLCNFVMSQILSQSHLKPHPCGPIIHLCSIRFLIVSNPSKLLFEY